MAGCFGVNRAVALVDVGYCGVHLNTSQAKGVRLSTVGDRIKEERERLKMSQTEFADLGGVQKRAQIHYEKGERVPDALYLVAVAARGVDVTYVLTGVPLDERWRPMFVIAAQATLDANMTPEERAESAGLLADALKKSGLEKQQQRSALIEAWERCSEADRATALRLIEALASSRELTEKSAD